MFMKAIGRMNVAGVALLLGIGGFLFTGCGAQKDGGAAKAGQITLKLSYWGSPVEDNAVKAMCKKYEEETGVKVEPIYIPNVDYTTKMTSLIASNDTPDIAYIFTTDIYRWADEGLFADVYELMAKDPNYSYEDFIPQAFLEWQPGKAAGRRIATETIGLYYNKDLFDKAGVEYLPSKWEDALTWDQFLEVTRKLTLDAKGNNALSPNFDPKNIVQYGFNVAKDYDGWGLWIRNNGGKYYSDDGKQFLMSDPKCVRAIQFLADLCNKYHVMPDPTTAQTQMNNGAAQSLMTGKVAIFQDGQWACLDFQDMDFRWDTAVMPKGPDADAGAPYTYTCCAPISIFKNSKHLDEAYKLYMWLADPESALDLYKDGLWQPLLSSWYTDKDKLARWTQSWARPSGYINAFVDMTLNHVIPVEADYVNNFDRMDALIESALERVWMGTSPAQAAIADINVNSLLGGTRGTTGPK
jgi:multiple sugar transport system substrate-binding protein